MRASQSVVCFCSKMKTLLTCAFTGESTELQSRFFPELLLGDGCYSCALLDLTVTSTMSEEALLLLSEIRINCDIISDSYINGKQSRVIHQFVVSKANVQGNRLFEAPKNLNYFPVKVERLHSIHISIVDSVGKLLNITGGGGGGGDIICRIVIKRDKQFIQT